MEKKTIADPAIYTQTRHRDQGYKRVAALLSTLDMEEQVRVLKQLTPGEARGTIKAIAETGSLQPRDVERVQEEFGYCPVQKSAAPADCTKTAGALWIALFGQDG